MGHLDDEIDLRVLDGASKLAFGAVDLSRNARRAVRHHSERLRAWQIANPTLAEHLAILSAAALLEAVSAWLNRRR